MTPAELLKPRYKVIADWPNRQFLIGAILYMAEPIRDGRIRVWIDHDDQKEWYLWNPEDNNHPKDYPHLFQPIQWWEERKEEEIPEYLKSVSGPEIYQRVSRIDGAQVAMVRFPKGKYGKGTIGPIGLLNLLPATLEEYTTYIKSLKQEQDESTR